MRKRNPLAATLADRISDCLVHILPERRDEPLDNDERAFLESAVREWAGQAEDWTLRDVLDIRELRESLAEAEVLLSRSAPDAYAVRRCLDGAAWAAGRPDLTIPDAVDRFFGPD